MSATPPLRVLALCGSLRAISTNKALLQAAQRLAPEGMVIDYFDALAAIPAFNPDDDREPLPPAVAALRGQIKAADGLLISSPEYARGVAGAFKNALDWLVSDEDFFGKPVAIFNASPRAEAGPAALRLTLETMSARLIDAAAVTVPLINNPRDPAAILGDPALSAAIRHALDAFMWEMRG